MSVGSRVAFIGISVGARVAFMGVREGARVAFMGVSVGARVVLIGVSIGDSVTLTGISVGNGVPGTTLGSSVRMAPDGITEGLAVVLCSAKIGLKKKSEEMIHHFWIPNIIVSALKNVCDKH